MKRFFWTTGLTALLTLMLFGVFFHKIEILTLFILCCIVSGIFLITSLVFAIIKNKKWQNFLAIGLVCFFCSGAFVNKYAGYRAQQLKFNNKEINMRLQVISEPTIIDNKLYIYDAKALDGEFSYKVRLMSYYDLKVPPYDIVKGNFLFSGEETKYETFYMSKDIFLSASLCGYGNIEKSNNKPIEYYFYVIRTYINNVFDSSMGEKSSFAKALVLGETDSLPSSDYKSIQDAGVAHIVSVSGLHVSLLIAFLGYLISKMNNRYVNFVIISVVLFLFVGVCSFSPSAIRATLMALLGYGSGIMYKNNDTLNNIGLLFLIFLISSPFLIFSPSFLLSYIATLGIVLFYSNFSKILTTMMFILIGRPPSIIFRSLLNIVAVTSSCFILTLPLMFYFFGNVTGVSIVSNIVCLPIVNILFILCFLVAVIGCIPILLPLSAFLGTITGYGVDFFMNIVRFFANSFLGRAFINPYAASIGVGLGILLFIVLTYISKSAKKNKHISRWISVVCVVLIITIVGSVVFPYDANLISIPVSKIKNGLTVSYVDVGQGVGSAVIDDKEALVFDCGGESAGDNVINYLDSKNVKDIDTVIVSHCHEDHTNGVSALCEKYTVEKIIVPYTNSENKVFKMLSDAAKKEKAKLIVLDEDLEITFGKANIKLLTKHLNPESSDQNENSLVGVLSFENFSFLFTGDITEKSQERIVNTYGATILAKVYAVAHHGSKHSLNKEFLELVKPTYCIISVGENPYGHPANETIKALEPYGRIYRTDQDGTVEFVSDGFDIEVITQK